ncbi:hypothetical protein NPD5_290 [Clostridium sporogenes]|uniref:Uncharacterized protein n=1 Tax=Clostridium sporogenes TaxID=1509 RepID=A0A1J1CWW5_CLOSG|nr:hypothetical protein [Clostridium sporogenes]APF27012.1 hypothetical protein NPD7_1277 [Clostridium sporogenes]APH14760.1 hypothetical protein NPD5_290 [Clostridium sporogenes]
MLGSTAKISEIITALENMQGLNQKADLKSALIAKGINASESDGVANLIAKLNSANLVLNGKRWAAGTYYLKDGEKKFDITNLNFKPNLFLYFSTELYSSSTLLFGIGIRDKDIPMIREYSYVNSIFCILFNDWSARVNKGTQEYKKIEFGENYIKKIYTDNETDHCIKWYVFE